MPRPLRPAVVLVFLAALVAPFLLTACSTAASFNPALPCLVGESPADGRMAGAYPELEALIPTSYDGRPPDRLDSGRNCSDRNLGSMRSRGVVEVKFAGGLWEVGSRSGVSLAAFRGDGLTSAILAEFYEVGARTAPKTDAVETTDLSVGGIPARRLDTLNDESYQTVITWPGQDGAIRVVLVGSDVRETESRPLHESRVSAGLAAFTQTR